MTEPATTRARTPTRSPRNLSRKTDEGAPSAAVLTRMIRRLAARHANQPEVVAACEKWQQRVATLERQAQTFERESCPYSP